MTKSRVKKIIAILCATQEIADPLMDLKQGMETLRVNKTFRGILSTLLSIGIFLNGNEVGIEREPNDIRLIRLSTTAPSERVVESLGPVTVSRYQ